MPDTPEKIKKSDSDRPIALSMIQVQCVAHNLSSVPK